jgi:asparagine synthase (glutamine-hydrolysing)
MCGIAGFISNTVIEKEASLVFNMCEAMAHRGPDALRTECIENNICFGHSRLSIIDLNEVANQPMWSADKKILLVLNGEIYNFKKLKNQLSDYPYNTHSDTEVAIAAYLKWGLQFVDHLEGMFSIALHDATKQQTFLIRDRFGKKPLYYHENEKGFWFASEMRALIKAGCLTPRINKKVIGYYLQYQTVHFPDTIIEEVYQIPPGSILTIDAEGKSLQSYFDSNSLVHEPEEYDKQKLRDLFFKSVEKRLVSDVPLAVLLSAGIDSNLILAAAAKVQKMDAFTIGFNEKAFDESVLAAQSAKHYGANHHVIKLSEQDFLGSVHNTLEAMDHPSGDGPNTFLISEYIKKAGFTVALSGLGGDEVFFGYPHYANLDFLHRSKPFQWVPASVLKIGSKVAGNNKVSKLSSIKEAMHSPEQSMAVFRSNFDKSRLDSDFGLPYESFDAKHQDENRLNKISKTEMRYYMHDVLLRDADQMSMAHSLELRNPFLDHELVQYVWSIDDKKVYPPKNLLFDAFAEDLPEYILNKKKTGFTFPWDKWMKGSLNTFCAEQLSFLESTQLFKEGSIDTAWKKYLKGSNIYTWSRIWPLVSLGFWIKHNNIEY